MKTLLPSIALLLGLGTSYPAHAALRFAPPPPPPARATEQQPPPAPDPNEGSDVSLDTDTRSAPPPPPPSGETTAAEPTMERETPPPPAPSNETAEPTPPPAPAASPTTETTVEPGEGQGTYEAALTASPSSAALTPFRSKYLTISGYLQPQYSIIIRQSARPRDERDISVAGTRAGIIFTGEPMPHWRYNVHFVVGGNVVRTVTGVNVASNPDGSVGRTTVDFSDVAGVFLEDVSVTYRPVDFKRDDKQLVYLEFKLGSMRMPFTAQNRSPNTNLMFARRSTPNNVFLVQSSWRNQGGILMRMGALQDRIEVAGGVFEGQNAILAEDGTYDIREEARGALYVGRVDINPLGGFAFGESDLDRGKFKFGLGSGLIYFPTRLYDNEGFDTQSRARDLRASASLRVQGKGFYLQGEFLRRQRTDNLSNRPLVATAAYAQTSYVFPPFRGARFSPVGRFGWTERDQSFDPRETYFGEAGLALYLANDLALDAVRILAQYIGEWRVTEGESAQGGVLQVQVRW